jgi:hypothetical protein
MKKPLIVAILIAATFIFGWVNSIIQAYAYVNITSPVKGQQIPVGNILSIKGTSTAANASNHCIVSIIINSIFPYHRVVPASTNGTKDYTSWQFVGNSSYGMVKLGQNKITSKYSCFPNTDINDTQPNFVKYHSINITGIGQQSKTPIPTTKGVPGILTPH